MRVIAGKYRGRILVSPDGDAVRPTTDKVKESIFGSIQFDVAGSVFVDLFAGSGSMGIEALSRGADKVYFVDNSRDSISVINSNVTKILDSEDDYEIIASDYMSALDRIRGQVDIIFIDAPYKDKPLANVLDKIIAKDMMPSGGMIIYEHLMSDGDSSVREEFYISRKKRYGTIQVEVIKLR